jgi:tetratricopeptide (TPR) repeat protein
MELAERAVLLDPNDAGNRWVLGRLLAYERRWAESDAEFMAALELDPNHADAWVMRAEISAMGGQPAVGIEQAQRALRLNPHPPGWYYCQLGLAQYAARQYQCAFRSS